MNGDFHSGFAAHRLLKTRAVLRLPSPTAIVIGAIALAAFPAHAADGWVPSRGLSPIEQRIAVAVGPDRTTLWTSLRFDSAAGFVGVVLPVPDGAIVDRSSDAWFEALEIASAPRVLAPSGGSSTCPGEAPNPNAFAIAGETQHTPSLAPLETLILDDLATVTAWADLYGLVMPDGLAADLAALPPTRFVVARFDAAGGPTVTPTLRVVMPGAPPLMPLTLTRAAGAPLVVTTFTLGPGRASLLGTNEVAIDAEGLVWSAADGTSNYADLREIELAALEPLGAVVECASHEALAKNLGIAGGTATIDGVITTFFNRAAAYGEASSDPALCIVQSAAALASSAPVSLACPRGDLGVVGGGGACVEAVMLGETDPEKLRCGAGADDLAVALSGQTPVAAWLTRQTMRVADGAAGYDLAIVMGGAATVLPVLAAKTIDASGCGAPDAGTDGGSGSGSTGSGSTGSGNGSGNGSTGNGSGSGATGTYTDPGYYDGPYVDAEIGCGCSGTADTVDYGYETVETTADDTSVDQTDDSCSGDTSDTSVDQTDDSCSGDTSDTSYDSSSDGCSGDTTTDTSGGSDCSGDTSGSGSSDSCSGDTAGGSSGCDGSSSGGDASCDGGSASDCAVSRNDATKRRRMPKLSVMALGVFALLAPLRRIGRRKRKRTR